MLMTMLNDGATNPSPAVNSEAAWLSSASYWMPAQIVTSAWLEHAPFGFWLVDALRPHRVAELGTHFGFSFLVFAEAVQRLGIECEVLALDSWRGDDHAGFYGDEVYASVERIAAAHYSAHTRLLRGFFSESRAFVADDSVDLLHLDGRHGYDDVKEDFEEWLGTVRDGGIVLFHDIAEHDREFGVWRLWDEVSHTYPSFSFVHGHGLGVLGVGTVDHPGLQSLFSAGPGEVARIRAVYERLGALITRQAAFEAMPAEIDSLHEVVGSLSGEIVRLTSVVEERDRAIAEIRESTSWRLTRPVRAIGRLRGQRAP